MQFADITNDIAFRKIFGNEKKEAFAEADIHKFANIFGGY